MRVADVIRWGLSALAQQKTRSALTTLGVVIGTFLLIMSLSIGKGVREATESEFRRHDQLRTMLVWPGTQATKKQVPPEELDIKGNVSEEKKERLRQAILRRWQGKTKGPPRRQLTRDHVEEIRRIEHVQSVVPNLTRWGYASYRGQEKRALTMATSPDTRSYRNRIVAGAYFTSTTGREVVVSEYLLYRWGVIDDDAVEAVLGQKVRVEFQNYQSGPGAPLAALSVGRTSLSAEEEKVVAKAMGQLPAALKHTNLTAGEKALLVRLFQGGRVPAAQAGHQVTREELTIVGVIRDPTRQERLSSWESLLSTADLLLPVGLAEELFFRVRGNERAAFAQAQVRVDDEAHLKTVQQQIVDMGYETYSLVEVVEQVRYTLLLVSLTTAFMALVALVVAGLGITNTMLMSVLERTREIGIMKAVGARDRHVLGLFLVEGALIGVVGSAVGVLLSWLSSFPGDRVARALVHKHTPLHLEGSLFVFPWWLMLGVPVLVSALTMLSAVYPARRAARVNPITALRHE